MNNNEPDPLLSGKELPTFKFEWKSPPARSSASSVGKEATVAQLPISKGIAGVSMTLEPGVMRELHWHATAAEWAFVVSGRVRTTTIDPHGYAETNDFEPGDIWYFPRGYGHVLCCLGDQPTPLHPHLRQRLLLRVRHVQHQRLDRPRAQAALGQKLRPAGVGIRWLPHQRGLLRQGGDSLEPNSRRICKASSRRPTRTNSACSPNRHTRFTRAAANGASTRAAFPFRPP